MKPETTDQETTDQETTVQDEPMDLDRGLYHAFRVARVVTIIALTIASFTAEPNIRLVYTALVIVLIGQIMERANHAHL